MKDLVKNIIDWAKERKIDEKGTVEGRRLKTIEEMAELIKAICKNDISMIKDSIGDVYVTLVIGTLLQTKDEKKTLQEFYRLETDKRYYIDYEEDGDINNVKDFCGEDEIQWLNGILYELNSIAEIESSEIYTFRNWDMIGFIISFYAIKRDTTLRECVELAYNEISKRKGKMINGIFVKEEDLKGEI